MAQIHDGDWRKACGGEGILSFWDLLQSHWLRTRKRRLGKFHYILKEKKMEGRKKGSDEIYDRIISPTAIEKQSQCS